MIFELKGQRIQIEALTTPTRPVEEFIPGSYEAFAQSPIIQEVDRRTVQFAPQARHILDMGTGTGSVIEHLLKQEKLLPNGVIFGVDPDVNALQIARAKFDQHPYIGFIEGMAGKDNGFTNESFDLITQLNSVHLLPPEEVQRIFADYHRLLAPGGSILMNSAYIKDTAMPDNTAMLWGKLVIGGKKRLKERGFVPQIPPKDLMVFTLEDYAEMLKQAGFADVQTATIVAPYDKNTVKAICSYDGFAEGAFPGVDVLASREALMESAEQLFENRTEIPRGYGVILAQKAA